MGDILKLRMDGDIIKLTEIGVDYPNFMRVMECK